MAGDGKTGTILDFQLGAGKEAETYVCREGSAAEHDRGILYMGPWEVYADGFCEHVRRCARALAMAGWPVHLRSALPRAREPLGEDRLVDEQYADLLHASIANYAVQVQQVVPTPNLLARLVTHRYYSADYLAAVNARRVISTVWERMAGLPQDDVAALNACGQAWVGTPFHARMLVEEGVAEEKVKVVPCPFLPNDPHLQLAGRERKPGPPRFYHIGKWEPRKEQRNIFLAFMRAFKPGDAVLMLKTSPKSPPLEGYPVTPQAALQECLGDPVVKDRGWSEAQLQRWIFVFAKRLSTEQMLNLHRMGDFYVSLSRGEGFDMPALDAKLSGNRLVYTPSGGTQEFAGEDDFYVSTRGTVPCHPFYGWPEYSRYLDYPVEAAAEAMSLAALHVDTPARSAQSMLQERFGASAVGLRMQSYLRELMEEGEMP